MAGWPDSAEKWREATAIFGAADWDTGVLADAKVVDAGTDGLRERLASGDRHALDQIRHSGRRRRRRPGRPGVP